MKKILFYLLLASHVSVLLETNALLAMNQVSLTSSPCQIYIAKIGFPCTINTGRQFFRYIENHLESMDNSTEMIVQQNCIKTLSTLPKLSVLSMFYFFCIYLCIELYTIFRVELMHLFSFGTGRILQECFTEMFNDPSDIFIIIEILLTTITLKDKLNEKV